MAANTQPIFGRAPHVVLATPILGPTAVTATDGTGALEPIFQADPTEGSFVDNITVKPVGGNTVATVLRVFLCSETGPFTPGTTNQVSNTNLLTELTLPATTSINNAARLEYVIPIRRALPPGWRILVSFGTSTGVAGNGYVLTTFGSKF